MVCSIADDRKHFGRCLTWSRLNTAQTGDWRREEEFTDVTLVDKSGTLERKGEGEYLGKEVSIKEFGDKEQKTPGVQEFRSSGVQEFRSSGVQETRS